jgi:hypothetical protein
LSTAYLAAVTWAGTDRQQVQPIWAPPRRRPAPVHDLWRDGENRTPHLSARPTDNAKPRAWRPGHPDRTGGADAKPPAAETGPDPAAARAVPPQSHREVGAKRRRLDGFRQRPDLRLINGEGAGIRRTRSGRLRSVPRENPS